MEFVQMISHYHFQQSYATKNVIKTQIDGKYAHDGAVEQTLISTLVDPAKMLNQSS